jgi:hypothetical protein
MHDIRATVRGGETARNSRHLLAGCPSVREVCALTVVEAQFHRGPIRDGPKLYRASGLSVVAVRDRNGDVSPQLGDRIREIYYVNCTIAGKAIVIDEEDIHAA